MDAFDAVGAADSAGGYVVKAVQPFWQYWSQVEWLLVFSGVASLAGWAYLVAREKRHRGMSAGALSELRAHIISDVSDGDSIGQS